MKSRPCRRCGAQVYDVVIGDKFVPVNKPRVRGYELEPNGSESDSTSVARAFLDTDADGAPVLRHISAIS